MNSLSKKTLCPGFTLIELMVVVITLGVIASLALSNLNKVAEQGYCRNAQMNLLKIFNGAEIRALKDPQTDITATNATTINTNLKLNIDDPKFIYTFTGIPIDYGATATRTGGPSYSCHINGGQANSLNCDSATYCPNAAVAF